MGRKTHRKQKYNYVSIDLRANITWVEVICNFATPKKLTTINMLFYMVIEFGANEASSKRSISIIYRCHSSFYGYFSAITTALQVTM
jgi:hypothetical protein